MKVDTHDDTVLRIRKQIEAYIAAHPDAADTLDGVGRWWLGGALLLPAAVRDALDALVREGRLVQANALDGAVRYHATRR